VFAVGQRVSLLSDERVEDNSYADSMETDSRKNSGSLKDYTDADYGQLWTRLNVETDTKPPNGHTNYYYTDGYTNGTGAHTTASHANDAYSMEMHDSPSTHAIMT